MSAFTPDDIPAKVGGPMPHELPIQLRQLLYMVNGTRSVRELLSMGLRGVEPASFDVLAELGLIHRPGAAGPPRFVRQRRRPRQQPRCRRPPRRAGAACRRRALPSSTCCST